jgi:hypothetical protein
LDYHRFLVSCLLFFQFLSNGLYFLVFCLSKDLPRSMFLNVEIFRTFETLFLFLILNEKRIWPIETLLFRFLKFLWIINYMINFIVFWEHTKKVPEYFLFDHYKVLSLHTY